MKEAPVTYKLNNCRRQDNGTLALHQFILIVSSSLDLHQSQSQCWNCILGSIKSLFNIELALLTNFGLVNKTNPTKNVAN